MFNPSRLTLARVRRGLTKKELADKLDVTDKTVSRYEAGEAVPSEEAIDALSKKLRFPAAFFHGDDMEVPSPSAVSFRAMASMTASKRDRALGAGAIAVRLSDWIAREFELPEANLPQLLEPTPEAAAMAVRSAWGLGERPVKNMVQMLEKHGVRVFSLPEEGREIDAFSFWRDSTPFVFFNTEKSAEHGRFDAAHELGHLILHRDGEPNGRKAEHEANMFASAFLMPKASVLACAPRLPTIDSLIDLKTRWNVSVAALNHRLHSVGITSEWQYRLTCIEISKRGFRTREPNGSGRESSVVLQKVFQQLREANVGKAKLAELLDIDVLDLEALVFGLVMSHVRGNPTAPPTRRRNPNLRPI